MRLPIILQILLFASLNGFYIAVEGAFSATVESGEEHCYNVIAPAGVQSVIHGNFDILDDDESPDPIGVVLYDSKMTPVWRSEREAQEGTFSITGEGKYELCIQNGSMGSDDYVAPKDGIDREVGFAIRVVPPQRGIEGEAGPDDRLTSHLIELSEKLMEGLDTMTDHQEYMRERENRHAMLADSTFNRVKEWTFLEAIVLVLISFGQVLYLKKFFEQRRYL
mmetsp:Transcript_5298/g.8112  ORF Transcript_5298/g.8112 Transcript_5298/m.8112 type:complete len:222 (-) Transcript_5298:122-787(-)|eukprot:scaffold2366_cov122-Skeletonema_dohrnii-CCMP3373.AAC.3